MLAEEYLGYVSQYTATYGKQTAVLMLSGMFFNLFEIKDDPRYNPYSQITELLGIQHIEEEYGRRAGVPDHSAVKYVNALTHENWTVVLLSQDKDSRGKVKKDRTPLRIVSPGTNLESLSRDAVLLGGLWLEEPAPGSRTGPAFAAAALDMSTGELTTYEGQGTGCQDAWSMDDLHHFFQVYPPKELVLFWRGDALGRPAEGKIRHLLGIPSAMIQMRQASAGDLGPLEKGPARAQLLQRLFQPKSLLPLYETLCVREGSLTERTIVSTLRYAEDHCPSAVRHLPMPSVWTPADSVFLGNHALTQLNMIGLRAEDTVLGAFLGTYTAMGRRAMRHRLLYPVSNREKLEAAYEEIAWIQGLDASTRDSVTQWLRQICDLPRLHRRMLMAEVTPKDILDLDQSYGSMEALLSEIGGCPSLCLSDLARATFLDYRKAFAAAFSVEKARAAGKAADDLFCLMAATGPRCSVSEKKIQEHLAAIEAEVVSIAKTYGQDRASLRLECKEASISISCPKAVFQDIQARARSSPTSLVLTSKKSSHTIESPTLSNHYKTVQALREQLRDYIKEELPPACDALSEPFLGLWDSLEKWISHLDIRFTVARVSAERGFCRPRLLEDRGGAALEITGLRHPLIEAQTTRVEYVKHDVALGSAAAKGWLVYGMNASGKSSLMKAVGIATILAQCGCYVPASTFAFVPFRGIFTRILNMDDLKAGLSSFAVEASELREILARADAYSLVLGDEVCSGTETTSATALVAAVLEEFAERGTLFMFATHFHSLQALDCVAASKTLQVWHLKVHYDPRLDRLVYSRTLEPGAGSSMYGLEVARAMQMPASVLDRAFRIRRSLLGAAAEEEAPVSSWNSAIQRRNCEVCSAEIVRDLEVHHIRPRAEGGGNELRNLIVVCEGCHDKHHAGTIQIGPLQMTSDGLQREVSVAEEASTSTKASLDLSQFAYKPTVEPSAAAERLQKIESYLRKYPNLHLKRLVYDLRREEGIVITEQKLRSIRSSLS